MPSAFLSGCVSCSVAVVVPVRGGSKRIHNSLCISVAFVNVSCITLPILIKGLVPCHGSVL